MWWPRSPPFNSSLLPQGKHPSSLSLKPRPPRCKLKYTSTSTFTLPEIWFFTNTEFPAELTRAVFVISEPPPDGNNGNVPLSRLSSLTPCLSLGSDVPEVCPDPLGESWPALWSAPLLCSHLSLHVASQLDLRGLSHSEARDRVLLSSGRPVPVPVPGTHE